jgi:hypothetical protein
MGTSSSRERSQQIGITILSRDVGSERSSRMGRLHRSGRRDRRDILHPERRQVLSSNRIYNHIVKMVYRLRTRSPKMRKTMVGEQGVRDGLFAAVAFSCNK